MATKTSMTTEAATKMLAELYVGGLWPESDRACRADEAIRLAKIAGAAWDWTEAQAQINRAYHAFGAEPPISDDTASCSPAGYDWHRGCHPIQVAAEGIRRALGID